MRIEFLPPSPRAGEVTHEKAETALPLIAAGFARRAPEPEPLRPAKVDWRVETSNHTRTILLRGTCARGGERLLYDGDPSALKGAVFQHCCMAKPEPIPAKIIAEYAKRKNEGA